jgi:hypothetical protein
MLTLLEVFGTVVLCLALLGVYWILAKLGWI